MTSSSSDKTVGQYAYELQSKKDEKINPIDLQRAIHKGNQNDDSYENQVRIAVERGVEFFDKDFFVVVLFKKERLLQNVIRQYFIPRKTCPTPEYDQVVYKYDHKNQELSFVWVIPDKQSCIDLPLNKIYLPKEQHELLQNIEDFNKGKLDKVCSNLNKEILKQYMH